MEEKYYVKYNVSGFGEDPLLRYAGPYDFEEVHKNQKDIAGYEGVSGCVIITKTQFELDQQMNNSESS